MANQDFKSSITQLLLSIIIPIIFMVIGFVAYIFFKENAFPVDYELFEPADWASKFLLFYSIASVLCLIYNVCITLLAAFAKVRSSTIWWVYLILSLFISLFFPILMWLLYPEESFCSVLSTILFILNYILTFVISTANCSKAWKSFFPFSNNSMKKR